MSETKEQVTGFGLGGALKMLAMFSDDADVRQVATAAGQRIAELRQALKDLFEFVEFAEMSSRDMPAHEFEAIRDDAERQARAALSGASK